MLRAVQEPTPPAPEHGDAPRRRLAAELPLNFVRGGLMGTADMVPGVSGGTVALVVGVYERLVWSLRSFMGAPLAGVRGSGREARERLREVEWTLVLPLVLGILTAIAIGAGTLPGLIEEHPVETSALFFGLILASLAVPWRLLDRVGRREGALILAGAVFAFLLVGLAEREIADPALPLVFLGAAVAICAMVLPGVSGAYLLLLIGIYKPTLEAVSDRDVVYIGVFFLGVVAGLAVFARVLGWLLEHHHDTTMAALLGLMAGSLRALWPWAGDDRALLAPPDAVDAGRALALAAIGFVLVTALVWAGRRRARGL